MDVFAALEHLNSRRAASPLVRLVGEERWEAPDHPKSVLPQIWGGTEPNLEEIDQKSKIALFLDASISEQCEIEWFLTAEGELDVDISERGDTETLTYNSTETMLATGSRPRPLSYRGHLDVTKPHKGAAKARASQRACL
ncbi:hypothetical protein TNCV_2988531 [Trichonephila clavipes]|nr:hypothetical protein TNCV_2988531 [Trichonephila clavipes]